jgi:hypothetical protein
VISAGITKQRTLNAVPNESNTCERPHFPLGTLYSLFAVPYPAARLH